MAHDVWVTGYGLLSPLGESDDQWWPRLQNPVDLKNIIDSESYAPFHVYPMAEFDLGQQIPRPGDQRAMGPMMHYGVYAAGVALEAAGIKGDETLLAATDLLVASGGGERDVEVDAQILGVLDQHPERRAEINRLLSDNLRPTLFLAQLPNLFAGNISIVHGVTGSSRTFMGEEAAGVDAVRIAFEKLSAGQGDLFLVGGAFNAARQDMLFMFHAGGFLHSGPLGDLWQRPEAGICPGSAGAFIVLESRAHAEARGAQPMARLVETVNGRCERSPGAAAENAKKQWSRIQPHLKNAPLAVMSGASGVRSITREEHKFLTDLAESGMELAVRGTGAAMGHTMEAAFVANLILGLSCLRHGAVFPPLCSDDPIERQLESSPVEQVLITGWGHLRGEGMALLEAIDD